MYKKISDYGIIGNLYSVALVGLDGSIDWCCLPRIDSPSLFGALLDDESGGRFRVCPAGSWDSVARYLPDTNVLVTRFRTRTGVLQVTDFMPVPFEGKKDLVRQIHDVYRKVEVPTGSVEVEALFEPRFDYGRTATRLERQGSLVAAAAGQEALYLDGPDGFEVAGGRARARWTLSEGQSLWLKLRYGQGPDGGDALQDVDAEEELQKAVQLWRSWVRESETGCQVDLGPYRSSANRSALTLKLLSYWPRGTIAAAATTSLPERVGGERNWDYRFTWIRDTALALEALYRLGHISEAKRYMRWIEGLIARGGIGDLRILYGLRGEAASGEEELRHLDGYKGSRPVRIGNGAATQHQMDIYGELMDAFLRISDYEGVVAPETWPALRQLCDFVGEHWREKDAGIWEVRSGPQHFVYSKVMCWVALDRGLEIARRHRFDADFAKWEARRDEIKRAVLDKGWNEQKGAFVQHFETDRLDASVLRLPMVGFLPFDDPRMVSTVEAVQAELGQRGFLRRYLTEDGLPGGEGTFLVCTFWLIINLIAQGRLEETELLLQRIEPVANHLGLFAEEFDFEWNEPLGNFPQALTHIGHINCLLALRRARTGQEGVLGPVCRIGADAPKRSGQDRVS